MALEIVAFRRRFLDVACVISRQGCKVKAMTDVLMAAAYPRGSAGLKSGNGISRLVRVAGAKGSRAGMPR